MAAWILVNIVNNGSGNTWRVTAPSLYMKQYQLISNYTSQNTKDQHNNAFENVTC